MSEKRNPETPPEIKRLLATLAAVAGTHTQRRDLEHRYYRFHRQGGIRLRKKYRPR